MNTKPLVSVLMTSYNRETFIAEAIESVLESSYTNFEFIIVDDYSNDRTVEIARNYEKCDPRIKIFVNEKNLGDYHNRNKAASYAGGKYIKYLDSDDLFYKYSLDVFVYFMEMNPNVAYAVVSPVGTTLKPFPHIFNPKESIRHHFFSQHFLDCAPTGSIIRMDAFRQIGGFSGRRMVGDIEFGLKIAAKYDVMILPPALIFWREHGNQEVFIGINNNLYPQLMQEILNEFFIQIPPYILTNEEKNKILRKRSKGLLTSWLKKPIKKLLRIK